MTTSRALCGQPLPDITLPLVTGGELAFRALRGKRRLLYMWGSW